MTMLLTVSSGVALILLIVLSFFEPPLYVIFCVAVLISFLMVSDIKYPKLRGKMGAITVLVLFVPIAFPFIEHTGLVDGTFTDYALLVPLFTILVYLLGGPLFVRKNHRAK